MKGRTYFFITCFKDQISSDSSQIVQDTIECETVDIGNFISNRKYKKGYLNLNKFNLFKYKYINKINIFIQPNKDGEIEFNIKIYDKDETRIEEEEEALVNKGGINYSIKFKQNQNLKDIYFLFDYSQDSQDLFSKLHKINDFFFKISLSEKFLLYFEYLLFTKDDLKNESKYYSSLINDFITEVNKNVNKEFTMEILISILIASLYENDFDSLKKLRIKKDDINLIDIRENNLINLYSEIYLTQKQKLLI